jgi:hypothetical protein
MEKSELISFFSEFWGLEKHKIKDDLILDNEHLSNNSSVRFYQFIAALESNFNIRLRNVEDIFTFGDLIKQINIKK